MIFYKYEQGMKLDSQNIVSYTSPEKIGLEIECPFNFYYPELSEKHLSGKKYDTLSRAEKKSFTHDINQKEPALVEKLTQISNELGLLRGVDKYREFVYPATIELDTHISKTQRLIAENLLPLTRPLSTHITVGNISIERASALLVFLEQRFLTKKRLGEAFADKGQLRGGWGKGKGGIVYKTGKQLSYGDVSACELRTLKITMQQLPECLLLCKELLEKDKRLLISDAKKMITSLGLPRGKRGRNHISQYSMKSDFREDVV